MSGEDERLGLDAGITRRDFLGATLIASGSALLSAPSPASNRANGSAMDPWTGYGGVGDYARSNGNTAAVLEAAHRIRDGHADDLLRRAAPTEETFDLVVVGGGFSGLAAAFEFQRHAPGRRCLILDNHEIFGGEAKQNEFDVDGHRLYGPQGSNGFLPPEGNATLSDDVWRAVGMPGDFEFAQLEQAGSGLRCAWDSYDAMYWGERNTDVGHYFPGHGWVRNVWDDDLTRTPLDPALRADLLRAYQGRERFHGDDGLGPWLDSMSYRSYLVDVMGLDTRVCEHVDPLLAISNFGLCSDVISAYAAYLLALPGTQGYFPADALDFGNVRIMSFPGGNTVYARRIAQHLVPGCIGKDNSFEQTVRGQVNFNRLDRPGQPTRIRHGATVFDVRHSDGPGVRVSYLREGRPESVQARSVVMSTGGWVARRTVADLPGPIAESYADFHHGPALVVNVALRNWRFLERLGISAGRWYTGFGFFGSIRAPMRVDGDSQPFHPDKPTVMTFYVPFLNPGHDIRTQGSLGRAQLLARSYADYERDIRRHLNDLFGASGFDARRDIAGIVLNRWGHAYVSPQPGFYFGGRDQAGLTGPMKTGFDRVFFGHSELGSRMNYRNAIAEGGRAGRQAAGRIT